MNHALSISAAALLVFASAASPDVFAARVNGDGKTQDGIIVAGENGTKWCCPGGVKSDKCEQGDDKTPVGEHCNFASKIGVIPQLPPRSRNPINIQAIEADAPPAKAQPASVATPKSN